MVSAYAASFADLFLAVTALELFSYLDRQTGAGTTAQAPLLDGAAVVWLPSSPAAAGALTLLVATVAFMYHHLSRAAAPVAGASRRRLSGLVIPVLCASAGTLEYALFVQAAGCAGRGAQARALGLAALRALPAAATAAFLLGMMLIVVIAHVRAGGDGARRYRWRRRRSRAGPGARARPHQHGVRSGGGLMATAIHGADLACSASSGDDASPHPHLPYLSTTGSPRLACYLAAPPCLSFPLSLNPSDQHASKAVKVMEDVADQEYVEVQHVADHEDPASAK
ncbi:hypothetical protein C2845_PM09G05910 [Panicum miliaceum]|uniref:Uncharacterized protein n=1 Tax=Panicum miliaceum TaxID=4540 RepID=A0A3L6RYY7_PANMI|nr:hypothetical protein C2845_PM09G05910 [Panicum miliaceum]